MRLYAAASPTGPRLVLAHGAGAGQDHPWMTRVAGALAERGVTVVTFDFPYMAAGKHMPDKAPVLEEAYQAVWQEATTGLDPATRVFAGGKSMRARIASQAAARGLFTPAPAGLVFFGYPLHPPGKPQQRRDAHLPSVGPPMLFLHGSRDPFGTPDEMRALVESLPRATVEIFEGGDHSIAAGRRKDLLDSAIEKAIQWMAT